MDGDTNVSLSEEFVLKPTGEAEEQHSDPADVSYHDVFLLHSVSAVTDRLSRWFRISVEGRRHIVSLVTVTTHW